MARRVTWVRGTGKYVDPDEKTTYAVVGEDGHAFMVFVYGNPIPQGQLVRSAEGLAVRFRSSSRDDTVLPDLPLTEGMTGYWADSGMEVFTLDPTFVPPTKKERQKGAVLTPAAEPPAEEWAEQPEPAASAVYEPARDFPGLARADQIERLVGEFLERFRVWRGVGGVTVLIRPDDGYVHTAKSGQIVNELGKRVSDPDRRAEFWRALRAAPAVGELTERPIIRPIPGSFVTNDITLGDGWYLCVPGQEPRHVSGYGGFARVPVNLHVRRGVDMAVNTSAGGLHSWVGYIGQPGSVYAPIKNDDHMTVLALCPMGTTCVFDAVVSTGDGGCRVIRFAVGHRSNIVFEDPGPGQQYVVARGNQERLRVFLRPA
jgi:hypothetical protein